MSKKILVVDDEPHLAEMMSSRLQANRYDVITALTGEEGLRKATREKPDLILLDVLMPDFDGYQVLCLLKEKPETRDIPVIMLTVKNWSENIKRAIERGAVDYIVKPFDPRLLLDKIKGAFQNA